MTQDEINEIVVEILGTDHPVSLAIQGGVDTTMLEVFGSVFQTMHERLKALEEKKRIH